MRTWNESFQILLAYKRQHGHTNIPRSDPQLGRWVDSQRAAYSRKQRGVEPTPGNGWISDTHEERLNGIGFQWDCRSPPPIEERSQGDQNNDGQAIIVDGNDSEEEEEDEDEEGPMILRISYSPTDGTAAILSSNSASSVANDPRQRRPSRGQPPAAGPSIGGGDYGHEPNTAAHRKPSRTWDASFELLVAYKEQHGGDTRVPRSHASGLGHWVHAQRTAYWRVKRQQEQNQNDNHGRQRYLISQDRIVRLNAIGFHWTGRKEEQQGLDNGEETSQENNEEGRASPAAMEESCSTPSSKASRSGTSAMNSDSTSGTVAASSSFPLFYADLLDYQKQHGHARVPQSVPRLGPFVNRMRVAYWRKQRGEENKKGGGFRITLQQIEQLNKLGFEWDGRKREGQGETKSMPPQQQQQDESSRLESKQGDRTAAFGSGGKGWMVSNNEENNMSRSSMTMTGVTAAKSKQQQDFMNNNKRKRTTTTTTKITRANDSWEDMFQRFLRYYSLTGMGFVPFSVEFEGEHLGKWASRQRSLARHQDTSRLSAERMNKLTKAGFAWNETSSATGMALPKSQNHGRVERKLVAKKSATGVHRTSNRKKSCTVPTISAVAPDQHSRDEEQEDHDTAMAMPSAGRKMVASKSISHAGSVQAPSAEFTPARKKFRGGLSDAAQLPPSTGQEEELHVGLPGKKDRRKMLKHYLREHEQEHEHGHIITKGELRSLAKLTKGWSGLDLKRLMDEASLGPAREYLKDSRRRRRQLQRIGGTLPVRGGGDQEISHALRPIAMPDFEKAFDAVGPTSS